MILDIIFDDSIQDPDILVMMSIIAILLVIIGLILRFFPKRKDEGLN